MPKIAVQGHERPRSTTLEKESRATLSAPRSHFFNSEVFAACNSFLFSSDTFGYARSSDSNVSTTTVEITSRVNHLLSAGTTYHGACSVAVLRIISSYAS